MPNYAYLMLRRNDVPPGAIQLTDLRPNTSQRSLIYEPNGQSGYVNPLNVTDTTAVTALAAADPDGTGGADHNVTAATEYGLAAYLRDRVNVNPGALDRAATPAEALASALAIADAAISGAALDLAAINVILNANMAGADNDLAGGDSFGSVEDVLRILSGEVYRVPANTVLELTAGPVWRSLAERTAAIGANTQNFYTQGSFIMYSATQGSNFLGVRRLYVTGALQISIGEGILSKLVDPNFVLNNPKFTYGAGGTAQLLDSSATEIRTDYKGAVFSIYDNAGNLLS